MSRASEGVRRQVWQVLLYMAVVAYFCQGFLNSASFLPLGGLPVPALLLVASALSAVFGHGFSMLRGLPGPILAAAGIAVVGMGLSGFVVGGPDVVSRILQVCLGLMMAILVQADVRRCGGRSGCIGAMAIGLTLSGGMAIVQAVTGTQPEWSVYVAGPGAGIARGVGLEANPVAFAYAVVGPMVLLVAAARFERRVRVLLVLSVLVGALGLLSSGSRSGVLGVGAGCLCLLSVRRSLVGRAQLVAVSAVLVAVVGSGLLTDDFLGKGPLQSDSRLGATPLAYSSIIVGHPLGVGAASIEGGLGSGSGAARGVNSSDPSTLTAPHNGVLTAAYVFGWLPAIGLMVLWTWPIVCAVKAYRRAAIAVERKVFAGIAAASVAVVVQSSFHNASLVLGEVRGWLLLGFLSGWLRNRAQAQRQQSEVAYETAEASHLKGAEGEVGNRSALKPRKDRTPMSRS